MNHNREEAYRNIAAILGEMAEYAFRDKGWAPGIFGGGARSPVPTITIMATGPTAVRELSEFLDKFHERHKNDDGVETVIKIDGNRLTKAGFGDFFSDMADKTEADLPSVDLDDKPEPKKDSGEDDEL